MATELEALTCENCEEEYPLDDETQALIDDEDWRADYCSECHTLHLECVDCGTLIHRDDAHAAHATCCEDCGDSRQEEQAQEALSAARERLQELTDSLVELEDIDVLRAAIAALECVRTK